MKKSLFLLAILTSVVATTDLLPAGLPEKIGVYRPPSGYWFLDNDGNGTWNGCGPADPDKCIPWGGSPRDILVLGDWNGDGRTKVGVCRDGLWYRDTNGDGQWDGCGVDLCSAFGGDASDQIIVGKW